jgi:hypothetical protein
MSFGKTRLAVAAIALAFLILGGALVLLAGVVGTGVITWDVKGRLLRGGDLALFSLSMAAVGALGVGAASGLWRGRGWGRYLAVAFWVAAGALGLITDRSVPGPGEPLRTYVVYLTLLPAGATVLLLWGVPSVRRYLDRRTPDRADRVRGQRPDSRR